MRTKRLLRERARELEDRETCFRTCSQPWALSLRVTQGVLDRPRTGATKDDDLTCDFRAENAKKNTAKNKGNRFSRFAPLDCARG
jgi:hypothetical protein